MQKKNRTAKMTIDDLFESPRLRIAVDAYHFDPQLLKAIFIEIVHEATQVTKNTLIRTYAKHSAFTQQQMIPFLRSVSDFTTWNIWWGLSTLEQQLYLGTLDKKLTEEERKQLLEKIHKKFMQSNS